MTRILGTLIYCMDSRNVLLMERRKQPNLGLWVGPGGKVEADESPYECALRELQEETGLRAIDMQFRGLVTEVSPRPDWQWILFCYVTTRFDGQLMSDDREGILRWWPISDVIGPNPAVEMPAADKVFVPHLLDLTKPFYHARFNYNADLKLLSVIQHPA